MSGSIESYVSDVNKDTAKMQEDMRKLIDADNANNPALASELRGKFQETFNHLRHTLEEAVNATKNDKSPQGIKAYEGFQKALKELPSDSPAGAVELGRVFHAQQDVNNIL